jgi:hypothetical protein
MDRFQWDTLEMMAEKRVVAEQTGRELTVLRAQASQELDAPSTFQERPYNPSSAGRSTTIDFKPGPSLRRLEEIKRTGQFWD